MSALNAMFLFNITNNLYICFRRCCKLDESKPYGNIGVDMPIGKHWVNRIAS